mmetsp:Transcript_26628/g.58487  ORF Transcript_26628/g.58487 Transcript_26628/m.58487 type:complete len:519 (-) Transcript_26628:8-1564(-)
MPVGGAELGALPTLPLRADVLLCSTLFEEFEDGISEDFLRHYTGCEDLSSTEFLELQLDATSGSQRLESLGSFLPGLLQLRLSHSNIPTIRDLGVGLSRLRVLWLCRSALQDLSGITALPALTELYISFNDVRDLSPLCAHEALQILDVEGNLIEDFSEIEGLQMMTTLRELNLVANPVRKQRDFSRDKVLAALPQLEVLDDIPSRLPDEEEHDNDTKAEDSSDAAGESESDGDDAASTAEDISPPEHCFAALEEPPWRNEEERALRELRQRANSGPSSCVPSAKAVPAPPRSAFQVRDCSSPLLVEIARETAPREQLVEPSEDDLVVEGLKRARPPVPSLRSLHSSASARAGDRLHAALDRRGLRTAWASTSSSSTSYRPTTGSSSSAWSQEDWEGSSDLTMGDEGAPLAGNPLAAVRRRRRMTAARNSQADIRDLLRRFDASAHEECLPLPVEKPRPRGTPDFRISAPRLLTSGGAGANASGARARTAHVQSREEPRIEVLAPTFSTASAEVLLVD